MALNQSSPKLLRMELSPRLWRCGIAVGCLPAKEKPPVNATLSLQQSASVTSAFSPQWDMFTQMVLGEKGYLATLLAAVCSILSRKRSIGLLTLTATLYMRQPIVLKRWQVEETGLECDPSSCYIKCRVHFGESHISHVVWLALPWITSKAAWTLSLIQISQVWYANSWSRQLLIAVAGPTYTAAAWRSKQESIATRE